MIHPKYDRTKKYHDIALMKLDEPVAFTNVIKPICLQVDKDAHGNRNLTVTGFGSIDQDDSKFQLLKFGYVPFVIQQLHSSL